MTSALLLTALLAPGSDSVQFNWSPKKGETTVWSVTLKGKAGDKAFQADSSVTREVTKVGGEEIVVRSVVKDATSRTGADEARLQRPDPTTFTLDTHGAVLRIEGQQKDAAWRLAPFNNFVWPTAAVATGGNWTSNIISNGVAGRVDYTFESIKDGVAKVTFMAASIAGEKMTKGQGFWLVDTKSGRAVALHAEIQGLLDGNATYEMTLVK